MTGSRTRLVLWRHGQTDHNVERRFQGQADVPLNEVGLGQAQQAAAAGDVARVRALLQQKTALDILPPAQQD